MDNKNMDNLVDKLIAAEYQDSSDNNIDNDLLKSAFNNYNSVTCYELPSSSEKQEPELSEEEIKKIRSEAFKDPDRRFDGLFSSLEKNYKLECPPLKDISISEDNIITFDLGTTDPAESGRRLYMRKTVSIRPNIITPLVGCNGVGKSSMLRTIFEIIKYNRYFVLNYDNLTNGAKDKISGLFFDANFENAVGLMTSSEGECIQMITISELGKVIQILEGKIIRDPSFKPYRDTDHVFILLDAIDSGSSIDNIINLKMHMNTLIEVAKKYNKNLYIIIAANSFELARNEICWDVFNSKEIEFGTDYEAYREFIFGIRNKILKQWEKMEKKREEEKKKESSQNTDSEKSKGNNKWKTKRWE